MNPIATKKLEAFAAALLLEYFQTSVTDSITNKQYEGEIKEKGTICNIMNLGKIPLRTKVPGTPMITPDKIKEAIAQLVADQDKGFYFNVDSIDQLASWVKHPENTIIQTNAETLKETVDAFNLTLGRKKALAGNRIGTNYITGTVTVTVTTGAVVGVGTTFTASMVGKGFKATGHTKWYRIKTFTDTTHITIENDVDALGVSSAYDGGAIGGGTAFAIEADTPIQVTRSNIYDQLVALKTILDKKKIPNTGRYVVLPADIANLFLGSPFLTPSTAFGDETVKNGRLPGTIAGFVPYSNEQVEYDATTAGYHCVAGHTSAIVHGFAMIEQKTEEPQGDFGVNYKDQYVYGSVVPDERKKALAELYAKL